MGTIAESVQPTRKGRVWDIWIDGRPFHIEAAEGKIEVSAGCNEPKDWQTLRRLATEIATATDGVASEAMK